MRNIKLVIEYDGTDFVGWQTQATGRSVQEEISGILQQVLQSPVNLIGAGRTDSGVHARGQVANFQTSSGMGTSQLLSALNGLLPEDIRVRRAEEVPTDFHARYSARERVYRYFITRDPVAIERRYRWYVKYPLDVGLMQTIAAMIIGERDFASFCKTESEVEHHRCVVSHSQWIDQREDLVYEVRANRFLHGMVRALVGTMVDIGRGYTQADVFAGILEARDRRKAGLAAPPQGLFLEEVVY